MKTISSVRNIIDYSLVNVIFGGAILFPTKIKNFGYGTIGTGI